MGGRSDRIAQKKLWHINIYARPLERYIIIINIYTGHMTRGIPARGGVR
jgi:hypothetical protein